MKQQTIMRCCYLGRLGYQEALSLQGKLRLEILKGQIPDTILLLEHPPVITLGRSARASNVLVSEEELERRGIEVARVDRGGDVTYHGPGQLVAYPIRRIGRGIRAHVQGMADALMTCLAKLEIESWWNKNHPGVWTKQGKIAAVGVDARGGVTTHGMALNINPDLEIYQLIVPCGIQAPVTSIQAILGQSLDMKLMGAWLTSELSDRYGCFVESIEPEQLLHKEVAQ